MSGAVQNYWVPAERKIPVIILLFFLVPMLISCGVSEVKTVTGNPLILEELQFDSFNTLKFTTLSGGRIYRIQQEFEFEEEKSIVASFKFDYFKDSVNITDQLNPGTRLPYLGAELQNDRPVKVVRYFASVDVQLIYNITYPNENLVRVDLNRIASNGDNLYVGYALYQLNSDGNVTNYKLFSADRDNPELFTKTKDEIFTFDNSVNPQEEFYIPFFTNPGFPDVQFFSNNNILSVQDSTGTLFYEYEYGQENEVLTQILPGGQTLYFRYLNSSE